jgi:hypothetical protein
VHTSDSSLRFSSSIPDCSVSTEWLQIDMFTSLGFRDVRYNRYSLNSFRISLSTILNEQGRWQLDLTSVDAVCNHLFKGTRILVRFLCRSAGQPFIWMDLRHFLTVRRDMFVFDDIGLWTQPTDEWPRRSTRQT